MTTKTASDCIHRISIPTPLPVDAVNVYLVTGEPLVLIDTGPNTEEAFAILRAGLRDLGYDFGDIGAVLITHGHIDHVGLLGRVLEASRATAYAHPLVAERLEHPGQEMDRTNDYFVQLMTEFGAPIEAVRAIHKNRDTYKEFASSASSARALADAAPVFQFTAYHAPGHSASDTVFVASQAGLAFSGDHVLKIFNPNPLLRVPEPGKPRTRSLSEFRASLRRTRELDIALMYPGHGEPIRDVTQTIDRILGRHERRGKDILRRLAEGKTVTPYTLTGMLFPNLNLDHLFLGISSAIGHLEWLEDEGRVESWRDNGVLYFARKGHR